LPGTVNDEKPDTLLYQKPFLFLGGNMPPLYPSEFMNKILSVPSLPLGTIFSLLNSLMNELSLDLMKAPEYRGGYGLNTDGEVSTCPLCGYQDGFHVSFDVRDNKERATVILICPNCHGRFQLGWTVNVSEQ
jgi:hypothetical protein